MIVRKQKEISGHAAAVYSCAAKGNHIYSGSADKYVARWLVDEGVQDKFAIRFEQSIYALELVGEEFLVAGLADGGVHVFNVESRRELHYFTQHVTGVFSIKSNQVKGQVYIGDAEGNLSIWSHEFKLLLYLPLNCGKIRSIAVSDSGDRFALACQDETVRIFDTDFFNEIQTIQAHKDGATSVLFDPLDNSRLISGGKDALLKLWDLSSTHCLKTVVAHTFAIYDIVSVDGGNGLITASRDKNVKAWKTDGLEFVKRLDFKEGGHRHSVNALAKISEELVVSCSDDKRLVVWEVVS